MPKNPPLSPSTPANSPEETPLPTETAALGSPQTKKGKPRTKKGSYLTELGSPQLSSDKDGEEKGSYLIPSDKEETKLGKRGTKKGKPQLSSDKDGNELGSPQLSSDAYPLSSDEHPAKSEEHPLSSDVYPVSSDEETLSLDAHQFSSDEDANLSHDYPLSSESLEDDEDEFDEVDESSVETDYVPTHEREREEGELERVSKLIARAGIASRRAAEELITRGEVSVNGHFLTEPGIKADPKRDKVVVSGRPLILSEKTTSVLLLHKPKNVMTTRDKREDRPTVFDLLPHKFRAFHPVGRLDFDTSGVLLLTDDGELTHLLTHPSHGAEKEYEARVRGEVGAGELDRLRKGVRLEDGVTAPCFARVVGQTEKNALVLLRIREGRNRQVRRMLDAVGHPVSSLRRTKFAGVELEGLPSGAFRVLLPGEVKALRKKVETKIKAPRRAKSTPPVKAKPQPKKPVRELKGSELQRKRDLDKHAAFKQKQSEIAIRIEREWK